MPDSPPRAAHYVGHYTDRAVSILKVDGTKITDTGKKLRLSGQPASMRGGPVARGRPSRARDEIRRLPAGHLNFLRLVDATDREEALHLR